MFVYEGNMICLVYVDDKILCEPNLDEINQEIVRLGIKGEYNIPFVQLRNNAKKSLYLKE